MSPINCYTSSYIFRVDVRVYDGSGRVDVDEC